jgi:hypothetical protein
MSGCWKFTGLLLMGVLCLSPAGRADTPKPPRHVHKATKKELPPLPSGPSGPVQQVPLDSVAPVPPQVTYENEQLTIVAPNSTLADILRAVRKRTAAEIEIPTGATERVVTNLGPGPAREIVSELLNGSRFNYVLLGSAQDANRLTRVVLVAKTGPDNVPASGQPAPQPNQNADGAPAEDAPPAETADETTPAPDDNAAAEPPAQDDQNAQQPGAKTPQQLLQEMQQRQLMMQQQQNGQPNQPGQFTGYPPAGPHPATPPDQNQEQQDQPQNQ